RRMGVSAEDSKHAADQIGVEGRHPSRRPSRRPERIAEALTRSNGCANAAHFPAETEVVFRALELVGVSNNDPSHAQNESYGDHPELRCADASPNPNQGGREVRIRRQCKCVPRHEYYFCSWGGEEGETGRAAGRSLDRYQSKLGPV